MTALGRIAALLPLWLVLALVLPAPAVGGPPFLTDDPEPVEPRHWEFYLASQWQVDRQGSGGTLPHLELNYGARPGLQLHALLPATLTNGNGEGRAYGIDDVELGAKLRFAREEGRWPQVGIFPILDLATGTGTNVTTLPVWLQKGSGPWLTYGGGGVQLATGANQYFLGWLLQRQLREKLVVGAEAFFNRGFDGDGSQLRFNLGCVLDRSAHQHLLLSAGPATGGGAVGQAYAGYLLTFP